MRCDWYAAGLGTRLLATDPDNLEDHELLGYLLALASPSTAPDIIVAMAEMLLKEFGNLPAVLEASPEEIGQLAVLEKGAVAALRFLKLSVVRLLRREVSSRPVLSDTEAVADYLHARIAYAPVEEFWVLFMNSQNELIRDECFGKGTVDRVDTNPREILKRALDLRATGMILAHNHPSGSLAPSRADIQLTRTIMEGGKLLHIIVHDHLILSRQGHVSLRAKGLI